MREYRRGALRALAGSVVMIMALMGCMPGMAEGRPVALQPDDLLSARDGQLYTQSGARVVLRGTNLGGWLLQESWFCPVNKPDKGWGEWDTREAFASRGFTEEQVHALFKAYQDSWITERDLDLIQAMGMNCLRLPFWYRNFQREDGSWLGEADGTGNPGFDKLDWLIAQCRARGIYVVLDLHGAPGFQSDNHSSGRSAASRLFEQSQEGEAFRQRTIELWVRIAARYRDEPAVAAYDLLNEPTNDFPPSRKVDKLIWDLYDRILRGIRAVDDRHIISVEGVWEMHNLPAPAHYGWTNVLYQLHNYNWKKAEIDRKISDLQGRRHWQVPVYVGEFQSSGIWDYAFEQYNRHQVSWSTWTWKGTRSPLGGWFVWRNLAAEAINPETDSYEHILKVWGGLRTEDGFVKDVSLARVLEKYAREPLYPLD